MCKSCPRVLEKRDRILKQLQEIHEKIKAFLPKKRMSNDDFSSPAKYIGLNENEAPSQDFIPCVTSKPVKHAIKAVPSSSLKHLSNNEDSRTIYNAGVQVLPFLFSWFYFIVQIHVQIVMDLVNIVLSAGQLTQSQRLKHNILLDRGLMAFPDKTT